MSGNTLYVGSGQQYATIAAAVSASSAGDTVVVAAGTYTNDFLTISHDLTLQASGAVKLIATQQPPNGKAYIDEGGAGVSVTISGPFDISGVTVPDQNGAAVRYEGGNLTLRGVNFHDNQNGILGAADSNGVIDVESSTFKNNGVGGDGHTHNLYIGDIASFTFNDSVSEGANVGHEIKSRAQSNTITNSKIIDGSATASYSIDLPNAGNAVISNNLIQQGANTQNPYIIAYGEEGQNYSSNSLSIDGNTILNDLGGGRPLVLNNTDVTISVSNNKFYGLTDSQIPGGSNPSGFVFSNDQVLSSEPTYDDSVPGYSTPSSPPPSSPSNPSTPSSPPASTMPTSPGTGMTTHPTSTNTGMMPPSQGTASDNAPSMEPVMSGVSQYNAAPSNAIYRFFNTGTGSHFYTGSAQEVATIQSTRPDLVLETNPFQQVSSNDPSANAIYRFFNTGNGEHFLTSSQSEMKGLLQSRPDLAYEGVDFYEHATEQAGDTAVYRFFDNTNGSHLYTTSASEQASLGANPGFTAEGIAFWAPTSHQTA